MNRFTSVAAQDRFVVVASMAGGTNLGTFDCITEAHARITRHIEHVCNLFPGEEVQICQEGPSVVCDWTNGQHITYTVTASR
ncbi:hypothetical protein [Prescottella sp. R16]|uniref:Uncharacterized protein n=1 Tax=Nocardia thailandica TaxID=257275 RepID=A0ABW6PHB4_9NOCA|nr:hypothetical protein [Prescottella sp. R16]